MFFKDLVSIFVLEVQFHFFQLFSTLIFLLK